MSKMNVPICATAYGNTGYGDCYVEPSKIVGAIQVPSNFEIAEANVPQLQSFLESKISAAIGTRIFPYHNFISVQDSTEEETINTTDYGAKIFIRDGYYDFQFRYLKGGVMAHQQFAKNEGTGKYFLFYDDNNTLYGYKSGTSLKGIPCELFKVKPWRFPTGAEAAQYNMRFIINPIYMNKGNLGYIRVEEFNVFDIVGLQDVELKLVSQASNAVTVKALSRVSAVDLYDVYSSNLNQAVAWKAVNESGISVAITSVALDAVNKAWVVTLNSGTFAASDKVYLKLADASVLEASPILMSGFDTSVALTVEAPLS